jgi:nucleoside 2-deoxyribosyltransferase
MKIYLSGSIRGGREFQPIYKVIYKNLIENDHTVLAHHVASENVIETEKSLSNHDIYTQDVQWLKECDGVIAEVSLPSLGVGYEIAYALNLEKPVLALYNEERNPISAMILGNTSQYIIIRSYKQIEDLLKHVSLYLSKL